jgi:hypothetical protein
MDINGNSVYPGRPCPHSTGEGCSDYENRPANPCDSFKCGWIIPNSPLPEWMKPNNGKVIIIFNKLKWNNIPVDLAVPVGKKVPPRALNWLKEFSQNSMRPLIYTEQTTVDGKFQKQQQILAYGPPAFQRDMEQWRKEGRNLW